MVVGGPLGEIRTFWAARVLAVVLALGVTATLLSGAPPARAAPADSAANYTFAFQDADIGQVAEEILGRTLGLNYSVDAGVSGKMTFRIDRKLTRAQLLEAFEAALATQDVVMVRQGDSIVLMPRSKAKGAGGIRTAGEGAAGRRAGYEVVAVPLTYATPSEVAKAVGAIGPADAVIYADDKLGLIILGGDPRELKAVQETVALFDRSGLEGSKIRFFELQNASAQTVADELDRIVKGSGASGVTILPMRRLNGLFIFARTPRALEDVAVWVEKLDVASREETPTLWVYHPKNVTAEALGRTLNSVLSSTAIGEVSTTGAAPAAGAPPPPAVASQASTYVSTGDDVRVGVDKETNTLLISATPGRWRQILKILAEIDRTPDQVLIEARVLEVTLGGDFRFGVDWNVVGASGKLNVTSTGDKSGGVSPAFPGFAVTYLSGDLNVAVDALSSKTDVEVVSAPHVIVVDNRTANLLIGDQVPVVTQSSQGSSAPGAPIVVSTDYRSTGVILKVTPRVSGDDKIVLEISQEVSSVAKTTTSGIDSPTIQQRKFESTLLIRDGGTVALGGLISSTTSKGDAGVPYLKDVPVVGALFKSQNQERRRTELVVLIKVRIIRDETSNMAAIEDLTADLQEIKRRGLLGP